MKTFTKSKAIFTALLALSLSTAACAMDEGTEQEQETEVVQSFTKSITITDGENEVLLTLGSENQAALDAITENSYTIRPMFERPEGFQIPTAVDGEEFAEGEFEGSFSDVVIESEALYLQEGAIGYALEKHVEQELVAATAMGCSHTTHIDTENFVRITKNGSICTTGKISTRRFGVWTQRAYSNNLCPGNTMTSGRNPSDRVRAQVCNGMSYSLLFFN